MLRTSADAQNPMLFLFFNEKLLLPSPGRPGAQVLPVLASQVLGSQVWATIPDWKQLKYTAKAILQKSTNNETLPWVLEPVISDGRGTECWFLAHSLFTLPTSIEVRLFKAFINVKRLGSSRLMYVQDTPWRDTTMHLYYLTSRIGLHRMFYKNTLLQCLWPRTFSALKKWTLPNILI